MELRTRVAAFATALALAVPLSTAYADGITTTEPVFGKVVPAEILGTQRGRAVITMMDVDGNVQDNTAINNVTGRNIITGGSFANASGLSSVIQNSGNNVLIQNATILQLDLR